MLAAASAAAAWTPPALARSQTITCESEGDRREVCSIPGLDKSSVRLHRRLSDSRCEEGTSWGAHPNAIWVSKGCRAEFSYEMKDRPNDRNRDPHHGGSSDGGLGEITCESHGPLKNCRVDGLNEGSVTMWRQLSDTGCVKGRTWGTQPDLIWVESGCRAVFNYTRHGGSHSGGGGGYGGSGYGGSGGRHITCESHGPLQNCRVSGLRESSVRLVRQLSNTDCIQGRTWGTQPGIIWVESGCRAEFSYD